MRSARGDRLGLALIHVAGIVCLAVAARARAQESRSAQLIWMREPGAQACIDEGELLERVEQHLGVEVRSRRDAFLIEGRIAPAEERGFIAEVVIGGDASSKRELFVRGDDCRELDDALVLVVAAAIETLAPSKAARAEVEPAPEIAGTTYTPAARSSAPPATALAPRARAAEPPRAKPQPAPAPIARPPASEAPRDEPEPPEPDTAERSDPERALRIAVGPRLSAGLMPAIAGGGALAVHWPVTPGLRLELGASLWPAGSRPTDRGDASFQAARLDALVCPEWVLGQLLALYACAGPSFGALRASAELAPDDRISAVRPLLGLLGWAFAELRLSRAGVFRLRAGAGASLEIARDRFTAHDAQRRAVVLHSVGPVIGLAGLELSAAL